MLPSLHPSGFLEGLGIGLVFGILVGVAWEYAYEMIKEGLDLIKNRRGQMEKNAAQDTRYMTPGARAWVRRLSYILAFSAIVQVLIGAFVLYGYSRMSNFINCQGTYNSQSAEARHARVKASNLENNAFYAWLATLPPLLDNRPNQQADPRELKAFHKELLSAIRTHQDNLVAQAKNPYPPDPADTCGEY